MSDEEKTTIEIEVELPPDNFNRPRELMWAELVEEIGEEEVSSIIERSINDSGMVEEQVKNIVPGLYDNMDELEDEVE
ncbi:MAG: hypothetical protein ABEJ72_00175 [Candidatus Aenigmatarchaeota archaeon]